MPGGRVTGDGAVPSVRRGRSRFTDEVVTMAHGAGGSASEALLAAVFRPAFDDPELALADDGAVLVLDADAGSLVMTTDSFVVKPRHFAGGSIGTLAVCGTVNDLAVMGAVPRWLAVGFVEIAMDDASGKAFEVGIVPACPAASAAGWSGA